MKEAGSTVLVGSSTQPGAFAEAVVSIVEVHPLPRCRNTSTSYEAAPQNERRGAPRDGQPRQQPNGKDNMCTHARTHAAKFLN